MQTRAPARCPPHARGLHNPVQATAALDFVLKTYYLQFGLYKAVCCRLPKSMLMHNRRRKKWRENL